MLGGGDGRDAINCVSTAKHKKGRTLFIKGVNTIIIRANTRFAPTIRVLNDVAQTIHELSVRGRRSGFVRSTKNVRAQTKKGEYDY